MYLFLLTVAALVVLESQHLLANHMTIELRWCFPRDYQRYESSQTFLVIWEVLRASTEDDVQGSRDDEAGSNSVSAHYFAEQALGVDRMTRPDACRGTSRFSYSNLYPPPLLHLSTRTTPWTSHLL